MVRARGGRPTSLSLTDGNPEVSSTSRLGILPSNRAPGHAVPSLARTPTPDGDTPAAPPAAFVPDRRRGILLASITSFAWGTVPLAGQVALGGMAASTLSALRLAIGGAFIALVVARRSGGFRSLLRRPTGLVHLAAVGLTINYTGYMWGLDRAGPAVAQILIQTAPLFLIGMSVAFLGERPLPRHLAGAALAGAGVLLVSWNGRRWEELRASGDAAGVGLIIGSAACWALYATCHKHLGRTHGSGGTMAWIFLLSSLLTLPIVPFEERKSPDGVETAAIVYLCVNSVVAYWCFAEALRHAEASLVAVIATLGPVVTLSLLAITNRMKWERLPADPLTAWKLGGAALVIAGVVLAVTARSK